MSRAEENTKIVIEKMMPIIIEKTLKPTGNWGILFNNVEGIDEAWIVNDNFMMRWTDFGDFCYNRELPFLSEDGKWKLNPLTVANNCVFYDRGFNLDDYLQAQDRIHRISQKKQCNIYNLLISESIDVWIDKLLKAKQNAAFLAQGDITLSEYQDVADYSFGDMVKEILNLENNIVNGKDKNSK